MRKEDDHNKVYSSADILQYLRGTLSPSGMHRLEKTAMEDPFLADAITGMEKLLRAGGTPEVDLRELEKRLADSTRSKRATLHFSWRTAAACLLLAGAAALTYFFMSTPDREERALATVERTTSTSPGKRSSPEQDNFSAADTAGAATTPASPSAAHAASPAQTPYPGQPDSQVKVNAAQEAPSLAPLSPHKEAIVSADSRDLPTPAEVSAARSSRTASAKPIIPDTFPPTGDSIELNRENGIAALSKGRSAAVVVDRSGRNPAETQAQAEVAARSDSEKAAAYSLAKKTADREQQPETAPRYAMPAGGWEQWREYISKNKKVPPANSAVTGNQVLSFTVHRNGTISDIRMIHSLSPWHDAEAMRLLRQGPTWKILKGKQQVVSITIGFSNF